MDIVTIRFGSYTHPYGTTAYTVQRQAIFDGRNIPRGETAVFQINGFVHGDDWSEVLTAWNELDAAYSQNGADFVIEINGTAQYGVVDSQALGGIRVTKKPSIPSTNGCAHLKYLPFDIELQAIIPSTNSLTQLRSFKETLSFSGGGPRTSMIETLFDQPIKQQVRAATIYRATQSGQAVGMYAVPAIPAVIFPAAYTGDYTAQRESPTFFSATPTDYSASWSYQFESATPLSAFPNDWGTLL